MSADRRRERGTGKAAPSPSSVHDGWRPLDRALAAYRAGRIDASLTVRTDVADPEEQAVAVFFRTPKEMPAVEWTALAAARGRVLDLGAGAGAHALALMERRLEVTAAEPLPTAAEILRERGVRDVREGGLDALAPDERFDTVLLLMNGAGLAGSMEGLPRLLADLHEHLTPGGQVLLDSTDPRSWDASDDGCYPGEIHYQLEFEGEKGPPFPFLYIDTDTLAEVAAKSGWRTEVLVEEDDGRYLARLTRPE